FLRHRKALQGDVNAIPLASIAPHKAAVPDVAVESLVLSWRATKGTRSFYGSLLAFLGLVYSLSALLIIGSASWFVITFGDIGFALQELAAGGSILALLVIASTQYLPTFFGRRHGVTAMSDGSEGRTQFGRRPFLVCWEEVRLFEVDG